MKLRKRIFLTISFILFISSFFSFLIYLSFFYNSFEKLFIKSAINFTENISSDMIHSYLKFYNEGFSSLIRIVYSLIGNEKDLINFFIVDMNGRICLSFDEIKLRSKYNGPDRFIEKDLMDKIHTISIYHEKIHKDKTDLLIIQPFFDFYQRHIYSVIFHYSFNSLIAKSLYFFLISFSFLLILIIINYFLSNIFSKYVTDPIVFILNAIRKSHKENYQTKIDIKSDYEFNLLVSEFNNMMKIIKTERTLIINLVYSLKTGILAIDKESNIILCNLAFSKLLKKDSLPSKSQNCYDFFPSLKKIENHIFDAQKNGKNSKFQGAIFSEIPSVYFDIEIKTLLFDNHIAGVVVLINDITEETQIQKRLVQLQKGELINSLANGLAHDFNNLIGSIKSTAMLANMEIKEKNLEKLPEIGEYLDIIFDIAINAEGVVKHLLSLSKHKEFIKDKVNILNILDKVIKISNLSIDKSVNIKFNSYVKPQSFMIGDEILLEEMFFNLIINASHSMTVMRKENEKWGGTINIEINQIESFSFNDIGENCFLINSQENINKLLGKNLYKLTISDEGIGIDKSNFINIFQPFFSTKPDEIGTGLGLSMVLTLVELHKGIIDFNSQIDVGTTFSIFLPSYATD